MVNNKDVSVNTDINLLLKNALDWKQWMVDDLRILIEIEQDADLGTEATYRLIYHHLKTYRLVNEIFGVATGDIENELFDLPSIDYLRDLLPTLDLTEDDVEGIIEPMLELELDELSIQLKENIKQEQDDEVVVDDLELNDVDLEASEAEDSNDHEGLMDEFDVDDYSDEILEKSELKARQLRAKRNATEVVGKIWDESDDMISKLTKGVSKGVDVTNED